jgi:cytochrome c-type biogenesis protein CcsB
MTAAWSPLTRLLRFLGKVQFTTILLLSGVAIMTLGTVIESRGSRETAWSAVYGTLWFDLFLFLIGVNLVIAVVNRIPIRRHQWPFVVTHAAIVILLVGAWISQTYGYEGRLVIYEGEEENRLLLDDSEIRVRWLKGADASEAGEVAFPLPRSTRLAGRTLRAPSPGTPGIRIAEYLPDGTVSVALREGAANQPPGIEFLLASGEQHARAWLIADDPRFARRDLGPVEVEFRRAAPGELLGNAVGAGEIVDARVHVSPLDGGAAIHIPLPEDIGEEVPCGPGVVARVREYFLRARVVGGELRELDSGEINPAAVVEIRAGSRTEVHTVFGRYPDFEMVDGRDSDAPPIAAVRMEASTRPAKPRIAILLGPDHELRAQIVPASGPSAVVPVAVGRSLPLAAIGLELQVKRLLANARPDFDVRPSTDAGRTGRSYLRLEAHLDGTAGSLWLERGGARRQAVLEGAGRIEATFGPQLRTIPFAVALEEFELIRHPGSSRPAEYRSRVQIKPDAPDLPPRREVISMNRPLDVAGFRLFQSSYRLGEGERPDATILTVSYDPGVPIVYTSFAILILGIAWGLRGVRRKKGLALPGPETRGSSPAAGGTMARRAAPGGAVPGARMLGLLFAILASLIPAAGWARSPAASATGSEARLPVEETRGWAILADGRVKPLLTYANETVLAVTGRERFDGMSALEILWGYVLEPREFGGRPYIRVDSQELKATLDLDGSQKRFSFETLMNRPSFRELVEGALQRQRTEQELSRLEGDALDVYARLDRIAGLMSGRALTIVPIIDESGAWMSLSEFRSDEAPARLAIRQGIERLAAAYAGGDAEGFGREARTLGLALRNANPAVYPSETELARELFYEDWNSFGKAWKLYLIGSLLILLLGFSERPWGYAAGLAFIAAGFACHSIGLGTRWMIADRAPVSDMYESLVFMGWGAIALGLIAEALNRKRFLALSAGLMGFVCLAFSENLPIDSAINPLVPVLAHTYWLAVHVMTVMLSYSAFALAMVLGHATLFLVVFQRDKNALLSSLSALLYRTLQVGVLFLAAGIVFGAIWANESWGRYWGWDPKETWSLITFFVYLAIIHARFAGWLGHFGLGATAILGFLAVVMTYYGVNFILATGLHAYGFSEGGQLYAGLYAVLEIAIVAGARLRFARASRFAPAPVTASGPTEA